jgi:hypothetical protein
LAHDRDSPLRPVIAQLERAASFNRGEDPEHKLAELEALLAHRGAVQVLEEPLYAGRRGRAGCARRHWAEAGKAEKAVVHRLKAGERALAYPARAEAVHYTTGVGSSSQAALP